MLTSENLEYLGLDQRLGNRARRVYLILTVKLDETTYRPVKVTWLAAMLNIDRRDARRALNALVATSYLDRCGRDGLGGPYCYRLHSAYGEEGAISPPSRTA
jgi:DNA-binding IclR family transcriptional regulator